MITFKTRPKIQPYHTMPCPNLQVTNSFYIHATYMSNLLRPRLEYVRAQEQENEKTDCGTVGIMDIFQKIGRKTEGEVAYNNNY